MEQNIRERFLNNMGKRHAFTVLQVVIVMGIMMALAAVTVPVFSRARQSSRRARCASNLQQIYLAVRQYYQDSSRYPSSMAPLLPEQANIVVVASGARPTATTHGGGEETVTGHFGYIRSLDVITCPNDDNEYNVPHSSYDTSSDPVSSVWNYLGYDNRGTVPATRTFDAQLLVKPREAWDPVSNPVKLSLSNRFAPEKTVVTHCRYHRQETVDVQQPDDIYNSDPAGPARDLILRLDGTFKAYDVSQFSVGREPQTKWQQQDF
jgi:type II secretory pathway pseudopilin PulG